MYVAQCQQSQLEEVGTLLPSLMTNSRCCAVHFLNSKSKVPEKFKEFEARVFNDCGQQIGTLQSNNGGEYLSKEFRYYFKSRGIHHELSPEQNGIVERMNRTLMETARSMMAHAGLPHKFWAEAVETAAYITQYH